MSGPFEYIGGGHLPYGVPTVRRDPATGRFTKLSDYVKHRYLESAVDALNDFTNMIARDSLEEVPKGPREDGHAGEFEGWSLASSIRYPENYPSTRATDDYMYTTISYDAPYAHAQHEGMAVMVHHHPIIPGRRGFYERTDVEQEVVIEWKVENYTTPGTKSHFLSDPMKRHLPDMERYVGERVRTEF